MHVRKIPLIKNDFLMPIVKKGLASPKPISDELKWDCKGHLELPQWIRI
jgi:hypothetical protein